LLKTKSCNQYLGNWGVSQFVAELQVHRPVPLDEVLDGAVQSGASAVDGERFAVDDAAGRTEVVSDGRPQLGRRQVLGGLGDSAGRHHLLLLLFFFLVLGLQVVTGRVQRVLHYVAARASHQGTTQSWVDAGRLKKYVPRLKYLKF